MLWQLGSCCFGALYIEGGNRGQCISDIQMKRQKSNTHLMSASYPPDAENKELRKVLRIMALKMFAFNHGLEGDEVSGAKVQMCDI